MIPLTTLFGGVLILLGVIAYFSTGGVSMTALIPSFFGFVIGMIGASARNRDNDSLLKPLGITTFLALIGLLGTVDGIFDLYTNVTGQAISKALIAVFCFIYIVVAAIWFYGLKQEKNR